MQRRSAPSSRVEEHGHGPTLVSTRLRGHGNTGHKDTSMEVQIISLLDGVVVLRGPSVCMYMKSRDCLFGLLGLLGEEYGLDVWQNTTLGNGYTG